jgi:integrase
MLMQAIESYLLLRRSVGYELDIPGWLLRSFGQYSASHGATHVTTAVAIEWAGQGSTPVQRHIRLLQVIRFAKHVHAEDRRHEIPPSDVFGHPPRRRRVPYIFSPRQISDLVTEASRLRPLRHGCIRPHTYSTLFALLAATGLRPCEARALRLGDLTSDGLVIRKTKFRKNRLVPLHETVVAGLKRYLELRHRMVVAYDHLFLSPRGCPLRKNKVNTVFRRLVRDMGLHPGPGKRGPRLYDLRHAWAVRALETAPRGRDRIDRHMLAVSTYLGHSRVAHTYWYLEATPLLMGDIAERCEAFLEGEGS